MKLTNSGFFWSWILRWVPVREWMLTTQYMTIELGLEAQEAKPNSVAIGPELSGLGQWMPISLFFCHYFQTRTNQREPTVFSEPIISNALLLRYIPTSSFPGAHNLQSELKPFLFLFTVKLPHSSAIESLPNTKDDDWLPWYSKLNT